MTNYAYIWYNIQVVCILECSDVREMQKGKKYEKKEKYTIAGSSADSSNAGAAGRCTDGVRGR